MSQIKKGAVLSYVNIILNIVVGLMLTPFIIHTLGDSEYGLYTLIGSFVAYLTLMDLGLNNTIVRFVAKYRAEKDSEGERKFLGTTMLIYFVISVVLVIIGLVLYFNLEKIFSQSLTAIQLNDAKVMFLVLVFNIAITLPGNSFTAICNAYERFVFPRALSIARYVLRALTVLAVLKLGGKAIALVVIDTAFNLLMIGLTLYYAIGKLKVQFNFKERKTEIIKRIFTYSIWIFVLGITTKFLWNTGQFILGIKTNTTVVAVYAVGIMLGGFYGSFSVAISSVFLPRATQMTINNSKDEILEMMIKVGRISFMVLMFILTGFIILGREFIQLWVGDTYRESWCIALVMMMVYTIPLIQNFANSLIESYNKVAIKAIVYLICFSLGILFGFFLVPKFGALGMITGIALGWSLAQIYMNYYFHVYLKLNMFLFFQRVSKKTIFPILAICCLTYFVNSFLPQNWYYLIFKVCIYTIIYWVSIYFISMNEFEKQQIAIRKI
jgi:O-antigen/teichoic acid export membrane protein